MLTGWSDGARRLPQHQRPPSHQTTCGHKKTLEETFWRNGWIIKAWKVPLPKPGKVTSPLKYHSLTSSEFVILWLVRSTRYSYSTENSFNDQYYINSDWLPFSVRGIILLGRPDERFFWRVIAALALCPWNMHNCTMLFTIIAGHRRRTDIWLIWDQWSHRFHKFGSSSEQLRISTCWEFCHTVSSFLSLSESVMTPSTCLIWSKAS